MFNKTTLNLARHYANALMDVSVIVHPKAEHSELSEVVSLIPADVTQNIGNEAYTGLIVDHLEPLSGVISDIADTWEAALERTITALTSTVFPIFTAALDELQADMAATAVPDSSYQYRVEIVDLPMWFLKDPAWFTDNNRGTTPSFDALPELMFDPINDDTIVDILKSTVHKYDSKCWLPKTLARSLKATAAVFDGKGSSKYLTAVYTSEDIFTRVSDAVVTILLTRVMEDHPPAAIQVDPTTYRMYLRNVRLLAQSVITRTLPLIDSYAKLNKLVIEANIDKKYIKVFGHVYYTHYIPNNGTTDALLGRLISNDITTNSQDILGKIKRYTELFLSFTSSVAVNNSRYQVTLVKRLMRSMVDRMTVTELEEGILGVPAGNSLPQSVMERMFDQIDTFKLMDMNTLDMFIARVIGSGRFGYIQAEEFITDMIIARLSNDSHDAHTAMFVAVTNHVAEYLASKVVLQPVIRRV